MSVLLNNFSVSATFECRGHAIHEKETRSVHKICGGTGNGPASVSSNTENEGIHREPSLFEGELSKHLRYKSCGDR